MERRKVYELIDAEREYQAVRWLEQFDCANTPNDWVAYITHHLGKAVTLPWSMDAFRTALVKVAALAVVILEREDYAPRHYDMPDRCSGRLE